MARKTKGPWYWKARDQWCVKLGGRRINLAHGNANNKAAELAYYALMTEVATNPAPESGRPTVQSIIESYLSHAQRRLAGRSFYDLISSSPKPADFPGSNPTLDALPSAKKAGGSYCH